MNPIRRKLKPMKTFKEIQEMAIKGSDGERETPKQKAQFLIMDAIATKRGYWQESYETDGMTPKEIKAVDDQLRKLGDRVAKMCGYTKSWVA